MTGSSLGVAVIGYGWMGRLHAQAYLRLRHHYPQLPAPRLIGVADPEAGRRDEAVSRFGFERPVADWRELLDDPVVAAVSVTAPNHLHRQIATAAAAAGKHVWVEKPVGLTAADAAAVARAIQDAGVQSCVGFNYRNVPAIRHARELIAGGSLGTVTHARFRLFSDYAGHPQGALSWRFERAQGGPGVLGDLASHGVDLVRFLLGEVDEVVTVDEILARDDVDAVAICSSTDTHAELSVRAAKAGKAIFCEKPLSLDLAETDDVLAAVAASGVPFMVGFNRRFDPAHQAVRDAAAEGRLGDLHLVRITSRDPAPPPPEYVRISGGIFLDMTIHDFDMARYVTGREVVEVYARGEVRVDPKIGAEGDLDTAVVVLTHEDRTLSVIDNSREAVYGFDQRVEAFGSAGMAASENPRAHTAVLLGRGEASAQPLPWFFLDRYLPSYRREWAAFARYAREGGPSPVPGSAARAPVAIGLAAWRSVREGRPVRLAEIA